ncbi:YIF1 domain-containing protein [Ditylenchus destructor]|uniref:Protein YIF1 n=1 Tax=Ditylenchus destructor TaxID=166010 RepID=A0AAD4MRW4_9BILA|nr:YIF1 domain-containing protein [Ditylenchus destructor]
MESKIEMSQQNSIPSNPDFIHPSDTIPKQVDASPLDNVQIIGKTKPHTMPNPSKTSGKLELKQYFEIDACYLFAKVGLILFPFFHCNWKRKRDANDNLLAPRKDINSSDLYVPILAFFYVWTASTCFGLYNPEGAVKVLCSSLFYHLVENVYIIATKHAMNVPDSLIDHFEILAYTSYKYVGLAIISLVLVLFPNEYVLLTVFVYVVIAYSVFLIGSLHSLGYDNNWTTQKVTIACLILSVQVIWFAIHMRLIAHYYQNYRTKSSV